MVTKRPASRRLAMKAMKVMKGATKSARTKLGGHADFLVAFESLSMGDPDPQNGWGGLEWKIRK